MIHSSDIRFGALKKVTQESPNKGTESWAVRNRFKRYEIRLQETEKAEFGLFKAGNNVRLYADGKDLEVIRQKLAKSKVREAKFDARVRWTYYVPLISDVAEWIQRKLRWIRNEEEVLVPFVNKAQRQGNVAALETLQPEMFSESSPSLAVVCEELVSQLKDAGWERRTDRYSIKGHYSLESKENYSDIYGYPLYSGEKITFFHRDVKKMRERYGELLTLLKKMDGAEGFNISPAGEAVTDEVLNNTDWREKSSVEKTLDVTGFIHGYPIDVTFRYSGLY